jgi:hypothetical protein
VPANKDEILINVTDAVRHTNNCEIVRLVVVGVHFIRVRLKIKIHGLEFDNLAGFIVGNLHPAEFFIPMRVAALTICCPGCVILHLKLISPITACDDVVTTKTGFEEINPIRTNNRVAEWCIKYLSHIKRFNRPKRGRYNQIAAGHVKCETCLRAQPTRIEFLTICAATDECEECV